MISILPIRDWNYGCDEFDLKAWGYFDPTYKGLKLRVEGGFRSYYFNFDPTYKGLKLRSLGEKGKHDTAFRSYL